MRRAGLVLALGVAFAPGSALACSGEFPPDQWRQFRIEQDHRERAFVDRAITAADVIFVGRLVRVDAFERDPAKDPQWATRWHMADFQVERTLQGKAKPARTVQWRYHANLIPSAVDEISEPDPAPAAKAPEVDADGDVVLDTVTLSCWPGDDFDTNFFAGSEGYRYLVYLSDGQVLRASRYTEGPYYLNAEDEEHLVHFDPESEK